MAINWLGVPRDSTIFAGNFAEEDFFNGVYEFIEDKKEQEEEQKARQRMDTILTQSNQELVAKKLVKWRKFVTAGWDFVPINWDEESDGGDSSDTGKLASSPLQFSDSRLKGEVDRGEAGFSFGVDCLSPLADGFDLDWDDGRSDDTIEWATDAEDESAYEGEDLDEDNEKIESEVDKESSDPSSPARCVCTEDEETNSESYFSTKSSHGTDNEAEEAEAGEGWGDEFLSAGKEQLDQAHLRRGKCRKRLFESAEDEFPWAAIKRRCVERVNSLPPPLPVQQQNEDTGKKEKSYLGAEESSGEGSSGSFVDSESELNGSTEWATAPENESSAWETAQEDELDDSVATDNEEKPQLETSKSWFSVSPTDDEMESSASASSLSYSADESSVEGDEEIPAFSFSRQDSLEGAEDAEDSSRPASCKSPREPVKTETQDRPTRQVRKRKNIFAGLICAFIIKRFVNNFLLL